MRTAGKSGIVGVGAAALAALAVAGCGSSHGTPAVGSRAAASASIGASAISRAADVSGAAKGEKIAYTVTQTMPSLGTVTTTGTGAFNNSPATGEMTAQISVPDASGLGAMAGSILSNLKLDAILDDSTVYLQVPSTLASLTSSVTGDKPWVSVDMAKLAAGSKVPGLSDLFGAQSTAINPSQAIGELKAASSSGVTKVADVTVNGVQTTEYRGDLDLTKLSRKLPSSLRAVVQRRLARMATRAGATRIPYTVDIDADNLVRQISFRVTHTTTDGTKVPVAMTIDFLSYGAQPVPAIPSASETDNLDGLLSSWGHKAAAGSFPPSVLGG